MEHSENPKAWAPSEVVRRINHARGVYLSRHGQDLSWAELGRAVGWGASTITDIRSGKRPVRVFEIGELAPVLEVSAAWLAFGEDYGTSTPATLPAAPPLPAPSAADRARETQLAPPMPLQKPSKRRPA